LIPSYVSSRIDDMGRAGSQDQRCKNSTRRLHIASKPIAEVPSRLAVPAKKITGKPPFLPLEVIPNSNLADNLLPTQQASPNKITGERNKLFK
jgi:hypothetical protein